MVKFTDQHIDKLILIIYNRVAIKVTVILYTNITKTFISKKIITFVRTELYTKVKIYPTVVRSRKEGKIMSSEVKVKDGNIEDALKRFKRQCARNGVIQEVRKREHYEKPSVRRKEKIRGSQKKKILI